jgi:hypothetical protein
VSIYIMVPVFRASGLTPNEKLVALALADNAHDNGSEARPGLTLMCQKTALSERTVQRTLRLLVGKGVIEIQRPSTSTMPTVYRFLMSADGNSLTFDGGDNLAPQPRGDKRASRGDAHDISGRTGGTLTVIEPSDKKPSKSSSKYSAAFEALWVIYPRKINKAGAYRAAKARVKAGVKFHELHEATLNYAAATEGTEEKFILHGSTFFGPDDRWRDWSAIKGVSSSRLMPGRSGATDADWEAELDRRRAESAPPPKGFADSVRKMQGKR